jgi:hypothetical protein
MALHRRAAKRDQSEAEIVSYLRKAGWSVLLLSVRNGPDLCIGHQTATGGINLLVEVKTGKRKLRPGQVQWGRDWQGHPPYVLRDVADAEALTRSVQRLAKK